MLLGVLRTSFLAMEPDGRYTSVHLMVLSLEMELDGKWAYVHLVVLSLGLELA